MAEIARVVIGTSAAGDDLRLGGANALAEFYLGHRLSLDLDFFAMDPGRVEAVALELIDRLPGSGLVADVKVARRFADFQRLSLIPAAGGSELDVDLGRWMPPQLYPPVMVGGIRVEAFRELAAGKLLALVDRAEAKDALDLWAASVTWAKNFQDRCPGRAGCRARSGPALVRG